MLRSRREVASYVPPTTAIGISRSSGNFLLLHCQSRPSMKNKYIPISVEEFHTMEHPFGWKAEYWDGQAVFTPRELAVQTQLALISRSLAPTHPLLPFEVTFQPQAIAAFYDVFQDSVEFCNWPAPNIQEEAEKTIVNYFNGGRGEPLPVSVMVLEPNQKKICGLSLFIKNKDGQIKLDLLFVKPAYQRQGMATEMVASAVDRLYQNGIEEIYSSYHICNEISQKWHHKFGFKDIYSQFYIKLKYAWFKHEIRRHEQLGLAHLIPELIEKKDYWYSQLHDEWKH